MHTHTHIPPPQEHTSQPHPSPPPASQAYQVFATSSTVIVFKECASVCLWPKQCEVCWEFKYRFEVLGQEKGETAASALTKHMIAHTWASYYWWRIQTCMGLVFVQTVLTLSPPPFSPPSAVPPSPHLIFNSLIAHRGTAHPSWLIARVIKVDLFHVVRNVSFCPFSVKLFSSCWQSMFASLQHIFAWNK